jgi:hypothetical protein
MMVTPSESPIRVTSGSNLMTRWAQAALVLICLFVFNVTVAVSQASDIYTLLVLICL